MSDRRLALVGSYGDEDTITVVAVGPGDRLESLSSLPGPPNASFVLVGSDGRVHVTSETDDGRVHAYEVARDGDDVRLRPTGEASTGGAHPCHLAGDRSGRWVVAANYGDGTIAVLDGADGGLAGPVSHAAHAGSGPRVDRQAGPHAHATAFAPDGRTLVAADLGSDQLIVYDFDRGDGSLTRRGAIAATPGAGPRHLVFDRDRLYVVNELANTVTSYAWDGGSPRRLDECSTLPADAAAGQAAAIRLAPTGDHLLVSNRGPDSVAVIPVDRSGAFGVPSFSPTGGAWPRDVVVAPGGTGLVVANEHSDAVTLLAYDAPTGAVGPVLASVSIPAPSSVAFI